jgi:hypothetical protein
MSSIFTVAECESMISALKCRLIEDPGGAMQSVSVDGHTVSYSSAEDLEKRILLFMRLKNDAERSASGTPRINPKVARFA